MRKLATITWLHQLAHRLSMSCFTQPAFSPTFNLQKRPTLPGRSEVSNVRGLDNPGRKRGSQKTFSQVGGQ